MYYKKDKLALRRIRSAAIILAILLLGGMIHAIIVGNRILTIGPQENAAKEIMLDTSAAHLWFEEIICGDKHIKIEEINNLLGNAEKNMYILLGENNDQLGSIIALHDSELRNLIMKAFVLMDELQRLALERLQVIEKRGVGSDYDQNFDAVFTSFLSITRKVESSLQQRLKNELSLFKRIQYGLIVVSTLLASVIVLTFIRFERRISMANTKLSHLSNTDPLTEVANRRHFNTMLRGEWYCGAMGNDSMSLIMIDLDFFKEYNDYYGHLKGDECLHLVAATLTRICNRPYDLVARYGGEEFAVLLPGMDARGAARTAEHIQKAIADLKIEHVNSSVNTYLTISMGVASARCDQQVQPKELLAAADSALYDAKNSGRNCIRTADLE